MGTDPDANRIEPRLDPAMETGRLPESRDGGFTGAPARALLTWAQLIVSPQQVFARGREAWWPGPVLLAPCAFGVALAVVALLVYDDWRRYDPIEIIVSVTVVPVFSQVLWALSWGLIWHVLMRLVVPQRQPLGAAIALTSLSFAPLPLMAIPVVGPWLVAAAALRIMYVGSRTVYRGTSTQIAAALGVSVLACIGLALAPLALTSRLTMIAPDDAAAPQVHRGSRVWMAPFTPSVGAVVAYGPNRTAARLGTVLEIKDDTLVVSRVPGPPVEISLWDVAAIVVHVTPSADNQEAK
jgi:hypothetical protein